MKRRGLFHEIADAVRAKRRQTMEEHTMKQISDLLPKGVVAQTFAGGVVLVGTAMTTESFRRIIEHIPERLRGAVIGWKQTATLPRGEA